MGAAARLGSRNDTWWMARRRRRISRAAHGGVGQLSTHAYGVFHYIKPFQCIIYFCVSHLRGDGVLAHPHTSTVYTLAVRGRRRADALHLLACARVYCETSYRAGGLNLHGLTAYMGDDARGRGHFGWRRAGER